MSKYQFWQKKDRKQILFCQKNYIFGLDMQEAIFKEIRSLFFWYFPSLFFVEIATMFKRLVILSFLGKATNF